MMLRQTISILLIASVMILFAGCTPKPIEMMDMNTRLIAEVDRSLDDYLEAMGDKALEQLLELDSIHYGAFTEVGAEEMLVQFKVLDVPHAAGLDRTVVLICDAATLEVKHQKTFMADRVTIHLLNGLDERLEVLYIGSVTYQGFTAYGIERFDLTRGGWTNVAVSDVAFGERDAFFFADDVLHVFELTYEDYEPVYSLRATLFWDSTSRVFKSTPN